jgi:methionyl-tRNA formyltransferase
MNLAVKKHKLEQSRLTCLFVGDPNLGRKGFDILKKRFPRSQSVIWKKGDKAGREEARRFIRSRRWDLAISFYNDLLFKPEDLAAIDLPLNIHPARPELPGVGYDTIPLIHRHTEHGATLHTMNENIDDGAILHVLERPLPDGLTGKELRARNQKLCLDLLEEAVSKLTAAKCWREAEEILTHKGNGRDRNWSDAYISKKDVLARLEELKGVAPTHPVFQ